MEEEQPNIFCVTEHGLNNESVNNACLENYSLGASYCRTVSLWGGAAIFVRNDCGLQILTQEPSIEFCRESIFEMTEMRFLMDSKIMICSVIYRPPDDSNFDSFFECLDNYLISIVKGHRSIILTGDFNIDKQKHPLEFHTFSDLLFSYGLEIKIDAPTRISVHSDSCLDNFLTNIHNSTFSVIQPFVSDHHAILLEMPICNVINHGNEIEFRDISHQNIVELRTRLSWENWDDVFSVTSVNSIYDNLVGTVSHCFDIACPVKKIRKKSTRKNLTWLTDDIVRMKTQLKNLYSDWVVTRCERKKIEYNDLKKRYRKKILDAKASHISQLIKASDNPTKTSWNVINSFRPNSSTRNEPNISLEIDGVVQHDPVEVCKIFNNHFLCSNSNLTHHVFVPQQAQNLPFELSFFEPFSFNELRKIVSSMKNKNSSGLDGISSKIIKLCFNEMEAPLLHLVNASLSQGIFPDGGKHAIVKPIFKKDSRHTPQNYRPISLLPTVSKILEKAVSVRLMQFFEDHTLFFSNQFGYQKNKSTKLALIDFVNKCIDALEGGDTAVSCFIDLSKAFDCVNHSILINKLELLGVKGSALGWLTSYLCNRKQQTTINFTSETGLKKQFYSPIADNSWGVPQGSILGPILFLVYINDISSCSSIPPESLTIFADDTSLFIRNKNISLLERETFDRLNVLAQYFSDINLNINSKKTNFMFIATSQKRRNQDRAGIPSPSVVLDDEVLEESSFVDYLGVRLDDGLSWTDHVDKLASTIASNIFVLRNLAVFNNMSLCKLVYFSLIESHLRYSIVLWGLSSKLNLNRIFVLQKKAIRCMSRLRPRDSCREKFIELEILTVPSLFMFEVIMYVKTNNLIQPHQHQYSTRNHRLNPSVQHTLKLFETKPSYAGLKYFSQLPSHIQDIADNKKFKKELKLHLIEKCFYSLPDF